MARTVFDVPRTMARMDGLIEDRLKVVGALGVGWASDRLRANGSVVTSNLVNSVTYSTSKTQAGVRGKTTGRPLAAARPLTVRIGSNVVYAARVEFGFVGADSLGRVYNQPPKSYLRAGVLSHQEEIKKVMGG